MPGPAMRTARAAFLDLAPKVETFRDAVVRGLSARRKSLPAKFFYDAEGSALFDRITELPEYYPTRTEIGILERCGPEIAAVLGPGVQLVELGSGSSLKVRLLLDRLAHPAGYVGIDISRDHLRAACDRLAADYPGMEVLALCADYMADLVVPPPSAGTRRRVAFFPGSTIGNLDLEEASGFLARWRPELVGGGMLVGVDLKKDDRTLHAAYNDAAGVTAAFNLNILARINRELGGTFDLTAFDHRAFYAAAEGRIEMHLVSTRPQIAAAAGRRFSFAEGETIHTENSHKFSVPEFQRLARGAGYRPERVWTDAAGLFSLHWLAA